MVRVGIMVYDEYLGYDIDDPTTFDDCEYCQGMGIVPKRKDDE